MASSPILFFGSNSPPYQSFSNFYYTSIEVTRATLGEDGVAALLAVCPSLCNWLDHPDEHHVFPSSEHVWQSLKATDSSTRYQFTTQGYLGQWNINHFLDTGAEQKALAKQHKAARLGKSYAGTALSEATASLAYWQNKHMIGIVAKMAANPKHAEALEVVDGMDYGRETLAPEVERAAWLAILHLKFTQNATLHADLLATGASQLVEFDRKAAAKQGSHWGGCYRKSDGVLCGENAMGQYLMAVRDMLRGQ